MSCLIWHPCILAHTVTIMLLSPESRKGCNSVGSVNSEREQLTPKSSPTQVKTNFAVLQISVVFIPLPPYPSSPLPSTPTLESYLWCFQGRNWFSYRLSNSCWGRWSIISHWGFLCLPQSFRTALTIVHVYFLIIFLFSPLSSPVSGYHLWFSFAPII